MCNPKNYYIYVAHLLYIHAFLHRLPDVQTLLPSYTVLLRYNRMADRS